MYNTVEEVDRLVEALHEGARDVCLNGLMQMVEKIQESEERVEAPEAAEAEAPAEHEQLHQDLVTALKTVFDPEIPVDIYELGLIYNLDIDRGAERRRCG